MSRPARTVLLLLGSVAMAVVFGLTFARLPHFGTTFHPYRDRAVAAAVHHATANVTSSINYDQRALDTLGEELIFLTAVAGITVLLRPSGDERSEKPQDSFLPLDAVALTAYLLLAVTVAIGVDVVAHGGISPGGGFQGGVIAATGVHLIYVGGTYRALAKVRPVPLADLVEAAGAAAYTLMGAVAVLTAGVFLANLLRTGQMAQLVSGGSVPLLSAAVGVEIASGVVVMLARFLEQVLEVEG